MLFAKTFMFVAVAIFLAGCGTSPPPKLKSNEYHGLNLSYLDTAVLPGDDFFRYVNGGWISRTTIPDDRGAYSAFAELVDRNNASLKSLLEKAGSGKEFIAGTDQRKAADFYAVGMDSLLAEKAGYQPLLETFRKISAISNNTDLLNYLIEEDASGGNAFFQLSVSPDRKNSNALAVYLGSGGLGLPERDYYLRTDAVSVSLREKYKSHIAQMLLLTGTDPAAVKYTADRILLLETELARATMSKEDKRDPVKLFNRFPVNALASLAPSFNWKAYFTGMHISVDSVVVTEPAFLKGVHRIVTQFPPSDIRAYLRWSAIRQAAPYLHMAMVQASFDFNQKLLLGAKAMKPRWRRSLEATEQSLGEAVGKLFVRDYFPPEAREKATAMVENIRFAFADRIRQLKWMSDSTKKKALYKLSRISVKIGYPDKWKSYAGLHVKRDSADASFYANVESARRFHIREAIAQLGKPTDKTLWDMSPQTVNASYNPFFNEIVFPAGILQPPFYDYRADDAVNYGGIGGAIGHEISHGFDDEGSRFDAEGNLRNWWSGEDQKQFVLLGNQLVAQFDRYEPQAGLHLQGRFTLGENMGDLGGVTAAFDGLKRASREANRRDPLLQGLTEDQRFFMSWATIWRVKYREEALRTQVLTNEHAPGMYRANVPLSNLPEFYKAFSLRPGNKLYREEKDRVLIW